MRQVYGMVFSSNFGRMKFERKLLDLGLEPTNGRWVFEFDVTVNDRIVPATVKLMHSSQVASHLTGDRFAEINFIDYAPTIEVLQEAKMRLNEKVGTIFVRGTEEFSWARNENDKSKRRPSISL